MDGFDAADMTVICGPDREVQLIHRITGVSVQSRMLPTLQLNYVAALTDLRVTLADRPRSTHRREQGEMQLDRRGCGISKSLSSRLCSWVAASRVLRSCSRQSTTTGMRATHPLDVLMGGSRMQQGASGPPIAMIRDASFRALT